MVFKLDDNLWGARTLEVLRINVDDIDIQNLLDVHKHWDRVRGKMFAPSLRDFKLDDLNVACIPSMTLVDFLGPPFDYCYRFFGSKVVQAAGMELTGKTHYADKIVGFGHENTKIFPTIIKNHQPVATRTTWISVQLIRYVSTAIRMPLSADGKNVTGGVAAYHFTKANAE